MSHCFYRDTATGGSQAGKIGRDKICRTAPSRAPRLDLNIDDVSETLEAWQAFRSGFIGIDRRGRGHTRLRSWRWSLRGRHGAASVPVAGLLRLIGTRFGVERLLEGHARVARRRLCFALHICRGRRDRRGRRRREERRVDLHLSATAHGLEPPFQSSLAQKPCRNFGLNHRDIGPARRRRPRQKFPPGKR